MFKSLHPNIRVRIYTSFLSRIIGSMIFPFMAIYFTDKINAAAAGILLLINVIVQFLAGLYGGFLADMLGRKRLMVMGETMKLFAFTGMLLVNAPWGTSAIATFAMMLVISVATGFINPAAEAMLIDVSTKETRAFMYSINYWAVNLSLMLGLMIGGWLFKTHFFELLIGLVGMSVITLWMTSVLIKETLQSEKTAAQKQYGLLPLLRSYQTVIKDLPFVLFTLGGIAILSLEFQRNNFIAVRLEQDIVPRAFTWIEGHEVLVDGVRLLSLLTVVNTVMIVLFTAVISKWIKNKPEQPIMYAGFVLFGCGYAFMAFSNHIPGLFLAVVVLSIGELLYVPTRQSMLADIVDDSKRGAYMAFNGFVFQVGKMFGALGIIVGEAIGGMSMAVLYILFILFGIAFTRVAILKKTVTVPEGSRLHS
ncbi:MDR family MFS transporter [Sediminibacillus halophilus]|uniref:MFS transporter, DHA1 family, multidrug resistance protein B n=1 Tax=Sediminibacillus halophilus TaxID=482461 RepID=A0A1G9W2M7_9BACI|nr:MFS transporter [Sediminibacillus halophilus]SDM78446.1 MFS transporter, DHA1 family, multidrug resistance protein B [Sediminibacillus halophilus]